MSSKIQTLVLSAFASGKPVFFGDVRTIVRQEFKVDDRTIDRELQKLRRAGEISFDSKKGWTLVPVQASYVYCVDGKKYDWPRTHITGLELRASIPGLNSAFLLLLEGSDGNSDKIVIDTRNFDLRKEMNFYTAPPATFGMGTAWAPCSLSTQ